MATVTGGDNRAYERLDRYFSDDWDASTLYAANGRRIPLKEAIRADQRLLRYTSLV